MIARPLLVRLLLAAAAAALIAGIFLPIICFAFFVGAAPQGGAASLWNISPELSLLTAALIATVAALAAARPTHQLRGPLLITGTALAAACLAAALFTLSSLARFNVGWVTAIREFIAALFTLSSLARFGFHPYALTAVFAAALLMLLAAFSAPRPEK